MRKGLLLALAVAGTVPALPNLADAAPIDYIFTGTGTGTLDGTAFSGSFTVTEIADTSTVTSSGGEFFNVASAASFASGALSATLTGTVNEVIDNPFSPGYIGFAQLPTVSVESLTGTPFETYELNTALPTTSGGLSVAPATFDTSVGDLDFTAITALSFTATTVPEPTSLALMAVGFATLGFVGWRKRLSREKVAGWRPTEHACRRGRKARGGELRLDVGPPGGGGPRQG